MPLGEFLQIMTAALAAAGGAVGVLEVLHRIETRKGRAHNKDTMSEILTALETREQKATVVQMVDFIGSRVNQPTPIQRQEGPYGTLIGSTGQNRRSLAS